MKLFDELLENDGIVKGYPQGGMIVIPHPAGNTLIDQSNLLSLVYLGLYIELREIVIHPKEIHPLRSKVVDPSLVVVDGEDGEG